MTKKFLKARRRESGIHNIPFSTSQKSVSKISHDLSESSSATFTEKIVSNLGSFFGFFLGNGFDERIAFDGTGEGGGGGSGRGAWRRGGGRGRGIGGGSALFGDD